MIIEVNPNKKNKICSPVIGFEAENKVTGFEFDYSDWAADIGDGYLTLSVKRPTDTIPYPVSLTQTGTHKATWTVSSADVAFAGRGEVQLTYIVDDKVKKSAIYEIYIDRSLEPDGDIPDPYISWFEELLQVSVQVEADADRAEAAADSIKNLEAVAVTLPSGESATAEYDPETGVMSFGIPKGDKGDTGDVGPTGNGISSTVLNADYTLTINFTDGTSYTTPSIRGEQGIQGETGEAGNGIASTVLNPDYTLTITFTNGTTYTTPSIRGPEGAQGQPGPAGNGIDNVTMDASGYLTITFTDGSIWTSPTSLIGPVKDVKVNGESVVDENGVANITVPIITKTVSGNPIVLDDADGAVQALDVELLPVQDLHGYSKPWAGGAGKNKVDIASGSITATTNLLSKELSAGTYTFSAYGKRDDNGSWRVLIADQSDVGIAAGNEASGSSIMQSKVTFTLTETATMRLKLQFLNSYDTLRYERLQLELGSTATAYEPYANICPITGRTQTEITDRGVNQWDEQWELGGIVNATGQPYNASDRIRSKNYCLCYPSTAYFGTVDFQIYFYKEDKTFISYTGTLPAGSAVTTPAEARYFKIVKQGTTTYANNISVNLPSTDHDYHPYHGHTKTVTLPHTVYGADVDVTGGESKENRVSVDISTLNWSRQPASGMVDRYLTTDLVNVIKRTGVVMLDLISSIFVASSDPVYDRLLDGQMCVLSSTGGLYVSLNGYDNVADFKAAMAGQTIVYPLATPTDLQTTPTDVTLYKGDNVVSGDGNMTLTYVRNLQMVIDKIESAL